MAIELKNLDKELEKVTKKFNRVSGQIAKAIGEGLERDVKKAMDLGKEPDGVRLKNVAPFTERTKKEYKRQKLRVKPRFERTKGLKNSIKSTTKKGQVKVSSTGSLNNRKKVIYLLSTDTKSGKKKARIIFGLTNTRRKIVLNIINKFIKATFK